MLRETINLLEDARDITGILDLKQLHKLISQMDIEDLNENVVSGNSNSVQDDNPLVSAVVDEWIDYQQTRLAQNTVNKWKYAAKHIKDYFDKDQVCIKDLSPRHIAKYYSYKKNGDSENGVRALSSRTIKDHREVLQGSIEYAIEIMKVIQANPVTKVAAPKVETRPPNYYTQDQINLALDKIKGSPIEVAVVIAANFGLRRQEVMGLKWSAIDLGDTDKPSLTVRHTITRVDGENVAADRTKSKSSLRTLPIPENVAVYLRELKKRQEAMKQEMVDSYMESDYVVKWLDGHSMSPDYVTKKWRLFLKANSLPAITFHDIRHSFASLLIKLGFTLKEVQEWLGHADIKSTAIYTHLVYEDKERVAKKVNLALKTPNNLTRADDASA
jgi:integrase